MRRKALKAMVLRGDIMSRSTFTNRHASCRLVIVVTVETYVMSRFKPLIISDMRADVTL